jgi:hypothetical protein
VESAEGNLQCLAAERIQFPKKPNKRSVWVGACCLGNTKSLSLPGILVNLRKLSGFD